MFVKVTIDPNRWNVVIDEIDRSPRVTKDGIIVKQEINLNERFKEYWNQAVETNHNYHQ